MDNELNTKITALLETVPFSLEEKQQLLNRVPILTDAEKVALINSLENVVKWQTQVKIDEQLLELEEQYPQLIEKAKKEIMEIVTRKRLDKDTAEAEKMLEKLKQMAEESDKPE